jgi:hypothetical protein
LLNEKFMRAFISCSLRKEDKEFVDFVESILIRNGIEPFGTVGKYSAGPVNPTELMRENIALADITVIIATKRYEQKDILSGKVTYGPSEMIHAEVAMSFMANKPVVVIAQEGTDVGSFIPNITQFIILDGTIEDLKEKEMLLRILLNNACEMAKNAEELEVSAEFVDFIIKALAVIGGAAILHDIMNTKKQTNPLVNPN